MKTMVSRALALVVLIGVCRKACAQYDFSLATDNMNTFVNTFYSTTGIPATCEFNTSAWQKYVQPIRVSLKNASYQKILAVSLQETPFTSKWHNNMIYIIPLNIKGTIIDEDGEPVSDMNVWIEGIGDTVKSDRYGCFSLSSALAELTLVAGNRNYENLRIQVNGRHRLLLSLKRKATTMDETKIDAATGYQNIPVIRTTGSFDNVDIYRFRNNVAVSPLMKLPWLAPGLLFSNDPSSLNRMGITIRGLSTIYLNSDPLVVIDNWPWEGDIRNIRLNPNVIEKVTVLKDAAATAIWGVRAGNGVILITTKKGSKLHNDGLEFISNLTFVNKPNLFYQPVLPPKDFIDFEILLFNNGAFDIRRKATSLVSPVVDILYMQQKGLISAAEADARIEALKNVDNRYDIGNNFYRTGINQQYAVNLSGSANKQAYFFSASRDQNMANVINSDFISTSLFGKYQLNVTPKLKINMGIHFTESETKNDEMPTQIKWGYADLVDDAGNALTVPADIRQSFKDTFKNASLLDWDYRPFDDLRQRQNIIKTAYWRMEGAIQYRLFKQFVAKFLYLYAKEITNGRNYMSPDMYYTRHLINSYSEVMSSGIVRHIPIGGILDNGNTRSLTRNYRFQVDYDTMWNKHQITSFIGIEQRYTETKNVSYRQYGYDPLRQTERPVDYDKTFVMIYNTSMNRKIPPNSYHYVTKDYYLSGFMNSIYTFDNRYSVSGSVRMDQSNIFGSGTKAQCAPLWSAGVAWTISREKFYHFDSSFLKLRGSFGYSGSSIKTVPSQGAIGPGGNNIYNAPYNSINIAPNKNLRAEKVEMLNIGIDFANKNKIIEAGIEFFFKRAFDLLGKSDLDYTSGMLSFSGNVAEMKTKGAELKLNFKDSIGKLAITSTLLFSGNQTIVTQYPDKPDATWKHLHPDYHVPVQGLPPSPALTFPWMGLDGMNGDPRGLLNGVISKEYDKILTMTPIGDMAYFGPQLPVCFGSLYNRISAFGFYAACNIVYKGGHYLITKTVDYSKMANAQDMAHKDYLNRWQHPGDETTTQVPSLNYTNPLRDMFNAYASIRAQKADFFQLQQLELGYDATPNALAGTPLSTARIFVQVSNLGMLYQSAPRDINPDYNFAIPAPRQYAIGVTVGIK